MKHLKTYEGMWDLLMKLDYPQKHYFHDHEIKKLENFGFYNPNKKSFNNDDSLGPYIYDINLSDKVKQIVATKISKQLPGMEGFKSKIRVDLILNSKGKKTKYFDDVYDLINYTDSIISTEEKDSKKYNI